MAIKIHGAAQSAENLSGNLQYYTVYARSPKAYTDPGNATCVNILVTRNYADESQKNFEVLIQAIALRAMPVVLNNPVPVQDLEVAGAPNLSGQGFVWKFASELDGAFENTSNAGTPGPVGLLVDEIHGIVLPNGTVLQTKGSSVNIEFTRTELL